MTILNCKECDSKFYKSPTEIKRTNGNHFCSRSCSAVYNNKGRQRNPPKIFVCTCCKKEYTRTIKHKNEKFCSRACLKQTNNIISKQKRKLKMNKNYTRKQCSTCTNTIHFYSKSCNQCHLKIEREIIKNTTLGEYHNNVAILGKHPSWINAQVRQFNRNWNKELTKIPCANCGYSKCVDLAHIKAISSFEETATLGEINDPKNIIQLCKNCHWEFDHDFLTLEEIYLSRALRLSCD